MTTLMMILCVESCHVMMGKIWRKVYYIEESITYFIYAAFVGFTVFFSDIILIFRLQ